MNSDSDMQPEGDDFFLQDCDDFVAESRDIR